MCWTQLRQDVDVDVDVDVGVFVAERTKSVLGAAVQNRIIVTILYNGSHMTKGAKLWTGTRLRARILLSQRFLLGGAMVSAVWASLG